MSNTEKRDLTIKTIKTVSVGDRVAVDSLGYFDHGPLAGYVVEIIDAIPGRPGIYAVRLDGDTTIDCAPWEVQKIIG